MPRGGLTTTATAPNGGRATTTNGDHTGRGATTTTAHATTVTTASGLSVRGLSVRGPSVRGAMTTIPWRGTAAQTDTSAASAMRAARVRRVSARASGQAHRMRPTLRPLDSWLRRATASMVSLSSTTNRPRRGVRPQIGACLYSRTARKSVRMVFAYPDMLVLGRQSCYLLGRDRTVADIPVEHPSCSKQHAVIQFRLVTKRNEFGDEQRYVQYVRPLT